jgi:hypothetical protein
MGICERPRKMGMRGREREKEPAEARIIHKYKNPAAAKGENSNAPK